MVDIKYLDTAGLEKVQSIIGDLFATKNWVESKGYTTASGHNHDSRYYTESEIDTKLAGKAASSHTHTSLASERYDSNAPAPNSKEGLTFQFSYNIGTGASGWWNVLNMRSYTDKNYTSAQLITPADNPGKDTGYSGDMKWRQGRNSTWLDWKTILDSSNYTSYTVKKDGTGASGTWVINVTGSAGSVAWGNVTGKPSSFTPATHSHSYLPLSGGTLTGNLVISKGSTADVSYTSGNASIEFNSGEQPVKLMYSHYDSYRAPAGLKVIGEQADCWFEADGNIYGKSFYKKDGTEVSYNGHKHSSVIDIGNNSSSTTFAYSKAGLDYSEYTWLAGWNGYELRAINKSQFAQASHSHSYLPLAGGIMDSNASITFQGTGGITHKGTKGTYQMISFLDNTANNYGNGIRIGGGGTVIIGAGESSTGLAGSIVTDYNDEILHLAADGAINFYSNCDTIANRKSMVFKDGTLSINGTSVSLTGHNHDDRYYTETEVNNLLAGKANSSHTHAYIRGIDNRNVNNVPGWYMSNIGAASIYTEFCQSGGANGNYENRVTFTPWSDQSGQRPVQLAFNNSGMFLRTSKNDSTWNSWSEVSLAGHGTHVSSGAQTWAGVKTFSAAPVFSAGFSSSSNITVTGSVTASAGFFDTSDERLKNIIKPLDVDIDRLSEIRRIYFNYKDNITKQKIGVIAQDIQKVYPEVVNENNDGILTVDYSKLSVIALDAVDQLNQKNKELEDRLSKIENLLKDKGIL